MTGVPFGEYANGKLIHPSFQYKIEKKSDDDAEDDFEEEDLDFAVAPSGNKIKQQQEDVDPVSRE